MEMPWLHYTRDHAYVVHFVSIRGVHDINSADIPENWHLFLRELILWIATPMYSLEQHVFYKGYYNALAFAAYLCDFVDLLLLD